MRAHRTRTLLTLALIFVGALLLTVAVLLPTVLVPKLTVLPASIDQTLTAQATDADVLDGDALRKGTLTTKRGVPLHVDIHVQSQPPTDSEVVTLLAAVRTSRGDLPSPANVISGYLDQVTISRTTSQPQSSPVPRTTFEADKAAAETPRTGYQYSFPFHMEKRSYPVYDVDARRSVDAHFLDADRVVNGIRLNHYRQEIRDLNLFDAVGAEGSLTVPRSAIGLGGNEMVRMDLIYTKILDLWIEPTTGQVIDETQQIHRRLTYGDHTVTTLRAKIVFSSETINDNTDLVSGYLRLLSWGNIWFPLICGGVGLALGGWGVYRTLRNRLVAEHHSST